MKGKLWAAADALRNHLDPAEYKYTVLGLIFLDQSSDSLDARHADLGAVLETSATNPEKDEYAAVGTFRVSVEARRSYLGANAKQSGIGALVDGATTAIKCETLILRDVRPKGYSRLTLDRKRLGRLIDLFTKLAVGVKAKANRSHDGLRQVNEYFLDKFASAQSMQGGALDKRVAWLIGVLGTMTGHSFAAPHITGTITRIVSKHPALTPI